MTSCCCATDLPLWAKRVDIYCCCRMSPSELCMSACGGNSAQWLGAGFIYASFWLPTAEQNRYHASTPACACVWRYRFPHQRAERITRRRKNGDFRRHARRWTRPRRQKAAATTFRLGGSTSACFGARTALRNVPLFSGKRAVASRSGAPGRPRGDPKKHHVRVTSIWVAGFGGFSGRRGNVRARSLAGETTAIRCS